MDNNHELSELILSFHASYVELKNYIYGNDEISLHTAEGD